MIDREKLILAYMKEYEMTREAAEKRADDVIQKVNNIDAAESNQAEADDIDEEGEYWDVSELMCCKCFERWIAVRPSLTMLKDIECPRCKFTGAAIETGQEFYIEEDLSDDDNEETES